MRAVRFRFLLLGLVAVAAAARSLTDTDWFGLLAGGQSLLGGAGLHTYARSAGLQAGPPSLLAVVGLDNVTHGRGLLAVHLLLILVALAALWIAERAGRRDPDWRHLEPVAAPRLMISASGRGWCSVPMARLDPLFLRCLLVGMLAVIAWGTLAGGAHLDDGLAMLALAACMYEVAAGVPMTAAVLVGAAIAFKPWAIVGLPLLFGLQRRQRPALLVAFVIPAACWLPFVLTDHGTLGAAGRPFPISAAATVRLFGLHDPLAPAWLRSAELLLALAVALVAARRDGWASAVPAGMVARLLLDPATFAYYSSSTVLAVALGDLQRRRPPWRTAIAWCVLWAAPVFLPPTAITILRAASLLVLVGSYLSSPPGTTKLVGDSTRANATASGTYLQAV